MHVFESSFPSRFSTLNNCFESVSEVSNQNRIMQALQITLKIQVVQHVECCVTVEFHGNTSNAHKDVTCSAPSKYEQDVCNIQ